MKEYKPEKKRKDRSDRATVDKVLDKKTLKILEKLQVRGKLVNLQGSLCTGKESNVYLAEASTDLCSKFIKSKHSVSEAVCDYESDLMGLEGCADGQDRDGKLVPVAVKIFKTSIMPFKDRERYIRSEKRFQTFCTSNPRKLIKLWAEKEVRNLKRLNKAQIPAPEPVYLKNNILIMTLVGNYGAPAPKLRDAMIEDLEGCYAQCLNIMRNMYKKAGLIHADLSEFNLLYSEEIVHVIDVGQSVEIDHENAQKFLIMDINNINNFFSKKGVGIIRGNDLFEDITGHVIPSYLRDVNIGSDAFIPFRVSEVGNDEDYAVFSVDKKCMEASDCSDSFSECSLRSLEDGSGAESCEEISGEDELENCTNSKEERKKMKKVVKELNRIRRASRISNKEKKKIFKKYMGKKRKS